MSYSVYKHTFPNGKVYIGITSRKPEDRWKNGKGYKAQSLIHKAIQEYCWNNVKHEILFENLTKEEAEQKEIELINKYKSNDCDYGYNIENGGNSKGKVSERTKRKLSLSNTGHGNPFYGKKHTEEQKRKIRETSIKSAYNKKQILCIETNTKFESMSCASRATGISKQNISKACNKQREIAGGYHWEFI